MSASIQPQRQIVLFVLVGGIAATVNFGSRFIFSVFAGFDIAVVLAFFVGVTTAFMSGKRTPMSFLIHAYLSLPVAWPLFGKQFLVVARKP